MTWLLMTALLLAAAAVCTRPWWRGATLPTLRRRGANIAAYRIRLAELETERQAGLVPESDAEALKGELDARLLAEAQAEEPAVQAAVGRRWPAALIATLLLALFAGGWYALAGSWKAQQQLAAGVTQNDQIAGMVQRLAERLKQQPDDAEGWSMLGRSYFVMQRFDEAAKAYAAANEHAAEPNPEWLTDQGEALAFARDRDLQGTPAQLFEKALAVAPDYGKALWYGGMAAAQSGDLATARSRWTRLSAQTDLPAQVRQALASQLKELDQASGGAPGPLASAGPAAAEAGAEGQGAEAGGPGTTLDLHVSLAPDLAAKVPPNAVLFVFAKAESGPPMPLAVQRLPGQTLPADIKLDDTMAMAPALRLSAFERYVVTARLSGAGGAQAQSGDLEGSLHVARAESGKPLQLRIDRAIP
ncbi:MAG: c-type cytochrome biogenesis protein CcmI [Nevskia sp.]|nr:c-type cytochrome biogenesis protein CcmI [Nevskia sp.]